MTAWQCFWTGFRRGFCMPWTIFTDAPDYWQQLLRRRAPNGPGEP